MKTGLKCSIFVDTKCFTELRVLGLPYHCIFFSKKDLHIFKNLYTCYFITYLVYYSILWHSVSDLRLWQILIWRKNQPNNVYIVVFLTWDSLWSPLLKKQNLLQRVEKFFFFFNCKVFMKSLICEIWKIYIGTINRVSTLLVSPISQLFSFTFAVLTFLLCPSVQSRRKINVFVLQKIFD